MKSRSVGAGSALGTAGDGSVTLGTGEGSGDSDAAGPGTGEGVGVAGAGPCGAGLGVTAPGAPGGIVGGARSPGRGVARTTGAGRGRGWKYFSPPMYPATMDTTKRPKTVAVMRSVLERTRASSSLPHDLLRSATAASSMPSGTRSAHAPAAATRPDAAAPHPPPQPVPWLRMPRLPASETCDRDRHGPRPAQ